MFISEWMRPRVEKAVYLGLVVVSLFVVFNAMLWYYTNDIPHVAYNYYNNYDDRVVFADMKPTPLITELKDVKEEGNTIKVSFEAINVNATHNVKNFECAIDMKPWITCSSPVTIDLKEYDDNEHTLEIRVIDTKNGIETQPLAVLLE